jgi:circadian clock protein KaiC
MPSPSRSKKSAPPPAGFPKCLTGIKGLDEITFGGLPQGRPTLVCGSAGCGKTLLGMEFLVRGATEYNEPGVCLSFEETAAELTANVASLGFAVDDLIARKKLIIDFVFLERSLVEEAGDYDLEALFLRLGHAVDSIGAKRVLLDSIEALFAGLSNEAVLRSELRRLFRWLKERNLTAVITAERGAGTLTRHGLEEYISDCVILLDHRVTETISTRRLRVVKYRGSTHGTNEYPFLIEDDGMSVLPVTSLGLEHSVSNERVSTGVPELDAMLGGKGFYKGSSVLITGTAGTGKTSLSAHLVDAASARGERCVYFSFEESAEQVVRNMRSIGIDLARWREKGILRFESARPTTFGVEMHLVRMHKIVSDFRPALVVVDPISAFLHAGTPAENRGLILRLVDFLKDQGITMIMTNLTGDMDPREQSNIDISSLVDAWLLLRDIESGAERNRGLYVLKARGLAHSNQIREFLVTSRGVELRQVYVGEAGLLTGSARVAREAADASEALRSRQEIERRQLALDRKRRAIEAQINLLRTELETDELEARQLIGQEQANLAKQESDRRDMEKSRAVREPSPANSGSTRRPGGARK